MPARSSDLLPKPIVERSSSQPVYSRFKEKGEIKQMFTNYKSSFSSINCKCMIGKNMSL